jgi:predicted DNA-binding transcriptional regulator YafY
MTRAIIRHAPSTPTALRTARLLLALHCAGRGGLGVPRLREATGASRATLYRDLDRLRDAGWRLDVRPVKARADLGDPGVIYSLARRQAAP